MQWEYVLLWLGIIITLSLVEVFTTSLITIWFAVSALVSLVAAVLGATIWWQIALCLILGVVLLIFTRPLARRYLHIKQVSTNADRVLGQTARVTETIDNTAPSGAVYVLGKEWTARSDSGAVFAQNATVLVNRIEGVKLWVSAVPAPATGEPQAISGTR